MIDDYIRELGNFLGISGLALGESNTCQVILNHDKEVNIEADRDNEILYLYWILPPYTHVKPAQLHEYLLEGNFFGNLTNGAAMALDKTRNELMLNQRLPIKYSDMQQFIEQFGLFFDAICHWQEKLDSMPLGGGDKDGGDDSPGRPYNPLEMRV